jgi:hypothetical protein
VDKNLKYEWQQTVLDAFTTSVDSLPQKISIAERAIAARLKAPQQPDAYERIAINDALRALQVLQREAEARRDSNCKDIADERSSTLRENRKIG